MMSKEVEWDEGRPVPAGRDWFTVREAAAYLDKSEPTLFRWMKEGAISFYKVGRATRFTRDSLDAVIRKSTGQAEAEQAAARCAACGHSELIEGQIQSTGLIYFKPTRTRFWTLKDSNVRLQAKACAACGYIQLHADTQKLQALKPEDEPR
ncbi:MAG: helix-turn-helix domain-containing protein [Candidatus Hydrogenedens sp.]|nr:helix-turn-helix domain-containing protein [Candidatus Hydrogenedens sp.]